MSLLLDNRVVDRDRDIVVRYMSELPVKVGELATELGLKVIRAALPPKISGLIKPSEDSPSGFEIRVNKFEIPERQRFTVAHEIAHYLLHREEIGTGIVDSVMYRSNLTSRKEAEANRLAADIIMPANSVGNELKRVGGKRTEEIAEELAAMFRVSIPAMRVRLGLS